MTTEQRTGTPGEGDDPGLLLPWYVNGTLDAAARARVQAWLDAQPDRAEKLAFEQAVSDSLTGQLAELPADVGLQRLMRRLEPAPAAAQAGRASPGLLQRLGSWFATPRISWAMAAAVVLQAGVIGALLQTHDEPVEYRSTGAAPRPSVRVLFAEQAPEQAIRGLLIAQGAQIIGGPNQLGEYWLVAAGKDPAALRAALAGNPLVQLTALDPDGPDRQ